MDISGVGTRCLLKDNLIRCSRDEEADPEDDYLGQSSGVLLHGGANALLVSNKIRNGRLASGVRIFNDGTVARLESNIISNNGGNGVEIFGGQTVTLIQNKLYGNTSSGVFVGNSTTDARLHGNVMHGNGLCGVFVYESLNHHLTLAGNSFRDHAIGHDRREFGDDPVPCSGHGVWVGERASVDAVATRAGNSFARNEAGDVVLQSEVEEAERAAIASWWAAQHAEKVAARAAGAAPPGWVFPPDAFDVTVAPDEDLRAALDRCPPGGSMLLLPGTHTWPPERLLSEEVHVFGRGQVKLLVVGGRKGSVYFCNKATFDGLVIRHEKGLDSVGHRRCLQTLPYYLVFVNRGQPRIQACDLRSSGYHAIHSYSDPVLSGCKCVGKAWCCCLCIDSF